MFGDDDTILNSSMHRNKKEKIKSVQCSIQVENRK